MLWKVNVQVVGAAVNELLDVFWQLAPGSPLGREATDLLLRWDLTGEEKPEETFWQGLGATWGLGELLLAFWNLPGISNVR